MASPPVVRAVKLAPPPLPTDLVARSRLAARLDRAAGHAVTLVVAGPGYGKTTELAAWARSARRPVGWLSLDDADTDPTRLLAHLLAAVTAASPEMSTRVAPLAAGAGRDGQVLGEALADALVSLPDDLVLVLDDLHAALSPDTLALLEGLLAAPPPRLHLLVGSRVAPPLPSLARLEERGLLDRLPEQDLRFTADEAGSFLKERETVVGPDLPAEIVRRIEGWPAGIRAYAVSLGTGSGRLPEGSPAALRGYLAREVLARLPAATLDLLRGTAVLDRVSPPLAEVLTGVPAAQAAARLGTMAADRLFVTVSGEEPWHRVHAVLRDALLDDLAPEQVAARHGQAARWFAAQGMVADAAAHARRAGTPAQVAALGAELLARHGPPLRATEQWVAVATWLADLPAAVVAASPTLLLLRAYASLTAGRPADALVEADAVTHLLAEGAAADDPEQVRRLRLEVVGIRCRVASVTWDFGRVLDEADLLLDTVEDPLASGFATSAACLAWGLAMQEAGRSAESRPRLLAWTRPEPRRDRTLTSHAWLAIVADGLLSLDHEQLLAHLELARAACDTPEGAHVEPWFLAIAAIAHYQQGDLARAADLAGQGMAIAPGTFLVAKQELAEVLVRALDGLGRPDEAASVLAEHRRTLELAGSARLLRLADALAVLHAMTIGDRATVRRWLAQPESTLHPNGVRMVDHPVATRARALLLRSAPGDAETARREVIATCDKFRQHNDRWHLALALPVLALAHEACGDRDAALQALREALVLEPGRLVRRFHDLGEPMRRLLAILAADGADATAGLAAALLDGFPGGEAAAADESLLTPRERQVVRLIARLQTNKEIAAELGLRPDTVKEYTQRIYRKLGATNRREAVAAAAAAGIIEST